jgi:hypothetical protein
MHDISPQRHTFFKQSSALRALWQVTASQRRFWAAHAVQTRPSCFGRFRYPGARVLFEPHHGVVINVLTYVFTQPETPRSCYALAALVFALQCSTACTGSCTLLIRITLIPCLFYSSKYLSMRFRDPQRLYVLATPVCTPQRFWLPPALSFIVFAHHRFHVLGGSPTHGRMPPRDPLSPYALAALVSAPLRSSASTLPCLLVALYLPIFI